MDELAREGARRLIHAALQAEVADYIQRLRDERDEEEHALVVRNGPARVRKVTLGSGTVEFAAPEPSVNTVLPILYLWGLATGDFAPALHDILVAEASGLSPSSISRLTNLFHQDY